MPYTIKPYPGFEDKNKIHSKVDYFCSVVSQVDNVQLHPMKTQKTAKEKADLLKKNQTDFKKIGKRIKELRIEAGYSALEDFAHEHDIPRAQYGRYEQGINMKFSSLLPIIRAHRLTMAEFFAGIE